MKSTCPTQISSANYNLLARDGSVEARIRSAEACVGSPGVRVGSTRVFRYHHVRYRTARIGGLNQHDSPTQMVFFNG